MHRFFSSFKNINGDKITFSDKGQAHYIKDVLRLEVNDEVFVFDERGNEYRAKIEKVSAKNIVLKIKERHPPAVPKRMQVTVACAIPKRHKMDDIIDELTQLGVDRIIPLKTERVVVRLAKYKEMQRQERWRKKALNASQQSQRHKIPVIEPLKDIKEVLADSGGFDLKLIPTLLGERKSLKEVLSGRKPNNVLVFIGPEGDFSNEEVNLAIKAGFIPVSLGELVLRVDTAATAVASFLRLYENH